MSTFFYFVSQLCNHKKRAWIYPSVDDSAFVIYWCACPSCCFILIDYKLRLSFLYQKLILSSRNKVYTEILIFIIMQKKKKKKWGRANNITLFPRYNNIVGGRGWWRSLFFHIKNRHDNTDSLTIKPILLFLHLSDNFKFNNAFLDYIFLYRIKSSEKASMIVD